jgi:transcriptional regulator with GAF, ATPase, and Fis domain
MRDYAARLDSSTREDIGRAMRRLRLEIACVAASRAPVLILGETGVGKELVARAVHEQSDRTGRPYVAVDCGTLSDELAGSELFGYRPGAFTGAVSESTGLVAAGLVPRSSVIRTSRKSALKYSDRHERLCSCRCAVVR